MKANMDSLRTSPKLIPFPGSGGGAGSLQDGHLSSRGSERLFQEVPVDRYWQSLGIIRTAPRSLPTSATSLTHAASGTTDPRTGAPGLHSLWS